jgi:hypothetical protein
MNAEMKIFENSKDIWLEYNHDNDNIINENEKIESNKFSEYNEGKKKGLDKE